MPETRQEEVLDEVNFLTRSINRVQLLKRLSETDTITQEELQADSDVSRTTFQRNLKALEENGWIQRNNRTYSLTTKGKRVTDTLLDFVRTVSVVTRLDSFLACVSNDAINFELQHLHDATLTVADEGNPYAPVSSHIMAMKQADHFRCVLPSVGLQPMEIVFACVERGSIHEMIFGPKAADTVQKDPVYADPITGMLEADNYTALVTDEKPPFYLGLADDIAQIGVEDGGMPLWEDRAIPHRFPWEIGNPSRSFSELE